jgi:hypothetical protein
MGRLGARDESRRVIGRESRPSSSEDRLLALRMGLDLEAAA